MDVYIDINKLYKCMQSAYHKLGGDYSSACSYHVLQTHEISLHKNKSPGSPDKDTPITGSCYKLSCHTLFHISSVILHTIVCFKFYKYMLYHKLSYNKWELINTALYKYS